MAGHMRTELALEALNMALGRRRPKPALAPSQRPRHRSLYTAHKYRERLDQHDLLSMSRKKGDCWDSAVMERFFGSLKSEWTNGQRYTTREQARRNVIEYIEMHYNSDRLHSTLDYLTPRERELAAAA